MENESNDKLLSVVIPAHNEQDNIALAVGRVGGILDAAGIRHEFVFVDDGSSDDTWKNLCDAAKANPCVRAVRLTRCFGKEAAIYAGLEAATGDCSVVIDCDMQHPPEKIPEMWRLWREGYEIIEGVKRERGHESALHKFSAHMFYNMISNASGVDMSRSSDFKLLDRKAVLVLLNMPERNTFFRALSAWVGFRSTQVEFEVQPRTAGETKWKPMKLFSYAVSNITSFTSAPLYMVIFLGVIMLMAAIVLGIEALHSYITGIAFEGFTTVILLLLFIGSILMISLGIIGYYISKIYEEVKRRPRYVVEETLGQRK